MNEIKNLNLLSIKLQSESGLGDDLRVMDVVTNGINRFRFDFIGPKDNSKRFALIYLSLPSACLFTSHYAITVNIYDWIYSFAKRYVVSFFNFKILQIKCIFYELWHVLRWTNLCSYCDFRIGSRRMRKLCFIIISLKYLQL